MGNPRDDRNSRAGQRQGPRPGRRGAGNGAAGRGKVKGGAGPKPGPVEAYRASQLVLTEAHAKEVKAITGGRDSVDMPVGADANPDKRAEAFHDADLLRVRFRMSGGALEVGQPAATLVRFPRLWATKRGRYCRFRTPGTGSSVFSLIRARPSF